jgi:acyl dehydratase
VTRTFLFPIDSTLVLQFARAVGDPTPALDDPRFANLARSGAIVPPPTFLVAADHFDPECPRRPVPGEAWPGSGRITEGWTRPDGSGRGRGLHGEQVFEFVRHPRVGEVLTVDVGPGKEWVKPGRQGTLAFRETVSEFRDASGAPVATATWVSVAIQPSGTVGPPETGQAPRGPTSADGSPCTEPVDRDPAVTMSTSLPEHPLRAGELRVGDEWTHVVVEGLTLSHLVRYAGASGDFIALHHDARIAGVVGGYPDVFAHGMLTMGLSSRLLTSLVGTSQLRRVSAKMVAVVYPGDTLTTTVAVAEVADHGDGSFVVDLRCTTTNQRGTVVLSGSASAHVPL